MLPWSELGAILFGAGLFSFWLDSYFERECSEVDEARLRRLLVEQAPARKEAVIKASPSRVRTFGASLRRNCWTTSSAAVWRCGSATTSSPAAVRQHPRPAGAIR